MINQTASLSAAFVVGDQKVALPLCPDIKILTATFWNTNNGGKILCSELKNPKSKIPIPKLSVFRLIKFLAHTL